MVIIACDFKCEADDICITKDYVCDGYPICSDSQDEKDCRKLSLIYDDKNINEQFCIELFNDNNNNNNNNNNNENNDNNNNNITDNNSNKNNDNNNNRKIELSIRFYILVMFEIIII